MPAPTNVSEINYYLPLDVETRKVYREWIRQMIVSNTFFVVSDPFIQARCAALVSFNFHKYVIFLLNLSL